MFYERFKKELVLLCAILMLSFACVSSVLADSQALTLSSITPSGQAGMSIVVLQGNGFPKAINPAKLTVQLTPTGGGAPVTASAMQMSRSFEREQMISFVIPKSISVNAPTEYSVSLDGATIDGTPFSSANHLPLTVNPAPGIILSSSSAPAGRTVKVEITGTYTNFSKGITAANFGPGTTVGTGSPDGWGFVTVTSPTSATAIITVDPSAASGPRTITVRTGVQDATASFTVEDAPGGVFASSQESTPAVEAETSSSGISYTITDLGILGGVEDDDFLSIGYGINDLGQVTGISTNYGVYSYRAYLYSGGAMTDLGTLVGGPSAQSYSYGINNLGQVTGFSQVIGANGHAFLYSNGTMTDLGSLTGDSGSSGGYCINNSGQVTGFSTVIGGFAHAFLYSNGTMTDLGTLSSGSGTSYGYGINDSGQVTGCYLVYESPEFSRAFLYSNGTMTDLGTLGGSFSVGRAINNLGQITGGAHTSNDISKHAFLYSNGAMTDLGSLGGLCSEGLGINDSGQVVGVSDTIVDDYDDQTHAFLYSEGIMADLNALIPPGSGWLLYYAYDINNSGQITGWGININARTQHAFLLTPVGNQASTVTLTPSVTSPTSVGASVTFTAAASGGSGSYQYKYLLRVPGGTLATVRNYATTATWNWTTAGLAAGTYQVVVYARNAGSTKSYETYKSINYVLVSPASTVTLTPSVASPTSVGASVTFTAAASGGSGSYQYKYLLRAPGGTLATIRNYATTATWNWTTAGLAAGTYQVVVYARNAGSTKSYETYKSINYVLVSPASTVTLTPSVASPTSVGTPVTFTAAASGGSGSYQYKYLLKAPGGTLATVRNYATTATWNWTTTGLAVGTYQVVVYARNAGSTKNYETYSSVNYKLVSPASAVTLAPSVVSPATVGTPVTFTAAASGGSGSYQYKYLLKAPGGTLATVRDYATSATWSWTTTGLTAGTYQVVVHARNAGSTKNYETYSSVNYKLVSPASAVTLAPSVVSPATVGTPVTFTAAASGGSGSYQYKYLLKAPGGTLTTVRDYATSATWNWTTTGLAAGTYQVVVHARNAGSTKSYETYKSISYGLK
jgi:probable HAF family extracellular repeat protein